jgi:hypothetical protein
MLDSIQKSDTFQVFWASCCLHFISHGEKGVHEDKQDKSAGIQLCIAAKFMGKTRI